MEKRIWAKAECFKHLNPEIIPMLEALKRNNIKTVSEAIDLCKKENKSKKPVKTKKLEQKPDWYNKSIEEDIASAEEIALLEEKLKR